MRTFTVAGQQIPIKSEKPFEVLAKKQHVILTVTVRSGSILVLLRWLDTK